MMRRFSLRYAVLGAACAAGLTSAAARADVKLPAVFSDHMVLQRGMAVPVWGTADAGEEVSVSFGEQKQATHADDKGHWEVRLGAMDASAQPRTLAVSGKNKIELQDVLVGEVWVCSGQSNMSFNLGSALNGAKEVAEANHPLLRLFTVPNRVSAKPQSDLERDGWAGQWHVCDPKTTNVAAFTAVGYFFGRDLQSELKTPVGLIHSSWGGTPAESWTPHSYMTEDPVLKPIADHSDDIENNLPKLKEEYEAKLAAWKDEAAKAKTDGKPEPQRPQDPVNNPWRPSSLYNGMIQPIVPFAVKGAVWYQGESNAGRAFQYRKLLPAMIKSWRDAWHEPELDFYIVSLANFEFTPKEPGEDAWAELREAQAMTAAQPHNGQALAIDLADANTEDIHPHNKQEVGRRLALVALAKSYGKSVEYSGPQYKDNKIDGDKMILHFDFADGLAVKGGGELKGFQIAGEDKKWHWADAKIEDGAVVVTSKDVQKPAAVRYDWAINPLGNLYNKADLPAVPFRTDDWPGMTVNSR